VNEAETRIVYPRDWVELTPAFLQIRSSVGEGGAHARVRALEYINRDLSEERLPAALVASDNTIIKMLKRPDFQGRTVCSPLNPAEGVWIEPPFEEGRVCIGRARLDARYSTHPAMPAAVADRQLRAAGEIAEKAEPSVVADHESELSTRARRGRKPHDWELYRAKFYLMLDNDDVPAYADINISDYADRLMTWGRNNFDKSPEQAAMREKVAEWQLLWQRLKGASK
jgi:hypothetical protein